VAVITNPENKIVKSNISSRFTEYPNKIKKKVLITNAVSSVIVLKGIKSNFNFSGLKYFLTGGIKKRSELLIINPKTRISNKDGK
jgi:hypothetical protein